MNIANLMTLIRVILVPAILFFFFDETLISNAILRWIVIIVLYTVASLTDYFDGYYARKYQSATRFGEFVDPLADKILTISVFIGFIFIHTLFIPFIVLLAIMGIIIREVAVTALRIWAIQKNKKMETEKHGKLKTGIQITSQIIILVVLLIHGLIIETDSFKEFYNVHYANTGITLEIIHAFQNTVQLIPHFIYYFINLLPTLVILLSFFVTVFSGYSYFKTNWKIFSK